MKNLFLIIAALMVSFFIPSGNLTAQDAAEEKQEDPVWKAGAGLGLDFAQLLQINPKQGAGQNRLGIGGAVSFFAKYKKDRIAWDNVAAWQLGLQRLGSGVIAQGSDTKIPFQKAIDELRLNSKAGYAIKEGSKIFVAADFSFMSQLTPTYNGTADYPGNFLSDISGNGTAVLQSKLFSPAGITLSVGIDYKLSDKLSIYFSPIGGKWIIVADDGIAALNVHGNPPGENVFSALGALARMNYSNKFLEDRLVYTSGLALFSNYKLEPQNIDVDWVNEIGFNIFKGLQAAVTLNVFYDHDIKVQITDYNAPNGINGTGRRASVTEQFLLKYNVTF
ncbi:MAG: DUF3078 domain-containing protein [Saprospiraceae bacterium]|nr:DUF3078 domain-containing protein [Saprospiraceae bacterium]MCB9325271.1 DUF3078 domain-containing protein [Lewinellaceae bacterium]